MKTKVTSANPIEIDYETFGSSKNPPVVLNMGNSCDAVMWPDDFCKSLASHGLFVIRFDQRDTGLSSWVEFSEKPYTLLDMVQDIVHLLDELGIEKAHLVGYSTGGLIAQLFAIHCPSRILSLTLLMTSTDLTIKNDAFAGLDLSKAKLPPPKPEFIQGILSLISKPQKTLEEKLSFLVESFRLANGPIAEFDTNFFSKLFERSLNRVKTQLRKGGHESNHALATSATPVIQNSEYTKVKVPTLVISGSEDPIFPPPHGDSLKEAIGGSNLLLIEGMGHILNPAYFDPIVAAMVGHIRSSQSKQLRN